MAPLQEASSAASPEMAPAAPLSVEGEPRIRSLLKKTLSFRRKESQPPSTSPRSDAASCSASSEEGDVEDPVVALLEARNKQRVRFNIEGQVEDTRQPQSQPEAAKETDESAEETDPASPAAAQANRSLNESTTCAAATDVPTSTQNVNKSSTSSIQVKSFMRRLLFHRQSSSSPLSKDDLKDAAIDERGGSSSPLVWQSLTAGMPSNTGEEETPEIVHTTTTNEQHLTVAFTEDLVVRSKVTKLLERAKLSHDVQFRYAHAVQLLVRAHDLLSSSSYPGSHPLVQKVLNHLNNAHHKLKCLNHSADIVKMGIAAEEEQHDWVRALKLYTIAYRIRRDQLSQAHPSLVVLLNILGSIQVKRGELHEAMQIYQLALQDGCSSAWINDREFSYDNNKGAPSCGVTALLARAVTFREMGVVHERWNQSSKALDMYHQSLQCIVEWREVTGAKYRQPKSTSKHRSSEESTTTTTACALDQLQLSKSIPTAVTSTSTINDEIIEHGEMEVYLPTPQYETGCSSGDSSMTDYYNSLFPDTDTKRRKRRKKRPSPTNRDSYAEIDVALTLHQIAQLHRQQGDYGKSLDAFQASVRGMRNALGDVHPNVAAILGNVGNLHREMGDLDAAYEVYQQVLKIESRRLGLSHPEVAISLHNIGMIEAARHNYQQAISIFERVLNLQRSLFGDEHIAVATTMTCLGDVHERLGEYSKAMECYKDALQSKASVLGRQNLQVARILHKMALVGFEQKDCNLAEQYIGRAILIYRMNKIPEDHEWLIEADRNQADIEAAIALGSGRFFEC